jgi:pimeloyl-ACP methyl ester carboxylesterase
VPTPDIDGPITYEQMAQDTIAFLEQVVGGPAPLVGHSDGAPVALLVALRRPDLVPRLVFAAGVFHHDGWAPGAIDLDEDTLNRCSASTSSTTTATVPPGAPTGVTGCTDRSSRHQ